MSVNEKMTAIANAIREKTGGTEKLGLDEMPQAIAGIGGGYDEGYEAGKQAEHTRFMTEYQIGGTRQGYRHAFAGAGWTRESAKPIFDMKPTDAYMMFYQSHIEGDMDEWLAENGVTLDFSVCENPEYLCYQCKFSTIGTVDLSNYSGSAVASLFNSSSIVTIRNFSPPNSALPNNVFQSGLKNLTISGEIRKSINLSRCSNLTDASAQNVIDKWADLTGQTAQTLTVHPTVGGRLTDVQKAQLTAKNVILVY